MQGETTAGARWLLARVKQLRATSLRPSSPLVPKRFAMGLRLGMIIFRTGNRQEDPSSDNTAVAELIPSCDWTRSESLSRLMAAYARLARLPPPRIEAVAVEEWVRRVVALETRLPVSVRSGPPLTIQADGGQLDQLLINLVRNAVDATLETRGAVEVGWSGENRHLLIWVRDEGTGLADTANLFVPFYTTKPEGSGIGLALSRQIAEAHGGTLTLGNRRGAAGCEARLTLPGSFSSGPSG